MRDLLGIKHIHLLPLAQTRAGIFGSAGFREEDVGRPADDLRGVADKEPVSEQGW